MIKMPDVLGGLNKQAVWINLLYWNDFMDWSEKKVQNMISAHIWKI